MCVAKGELYQALVSEPFARFLQLCFPFLELRTHGFCDFLLKLHIDLWDEQFVEVSAAHWTGHASLDNSLVALEAHEVLAWSEDRLRTELQAHRALAVVALSTYHP